MRRLLILLLLAWPLHATDLYYANVSAGSNNGTDCADAYGWQDATHGLGVAGNWVAGNTYHLCGTITGTAGQTGITVGASGTVGNIITIKFETGASMTSPYWHTAIQMTNRSYITIDGGTNGVIINTANGTGLANQQGSIGIAYSAAGGNPSSGSNIEIKNLAITNIYVHTGTGEDSQHSGAGIYFGPGTQSAISIHDNVIHDVWAGIEFAYSALNGLNVYNNEVYNITWGIECGDNNSGASATNVNVYQNSVHDFDNWFDASFLNHTDGIFFFATNSSTSTFTNSNIYNNYLWGTININATAYISEQGGTGMSGITTYNNVISATTNSGHGTNFQGAGIVINFAFAGSSPSHMAVYNNTIYTPTYGIWIYNGCSSGTGCIQIDAMYNNIIAGKPNLTADFEIYSGTCCGGANGTPIITISDFNVLYNATHIALNGANGTQYNSIAAWQGVCSCGESHSVITNPNLNSTTYVLQAGSSAIGLGKNLTSLGITNLDKGAPANFGANSTCGSGCVARASSGAIWDSGAYPFASLWTPTANGRDYTNGNPQNGLGYSNGVTGANGRKYP